MDIDTAFGGLKGSMPHDAAFQGLHFRYGAKGESVLIETKKTFIHEDHVCIACGQKIGEKTVRFFYWLLCGERFKLVHASSRPRLRETATIDDHLFKPTEIYSQ